MRAGGGGRGDVASKVVAAGLLGLQCLMPAAALANQMASQSPAVVAGVGKAKPTATPATPGRETFMKPAAALSPEEEMIGAFKTADGDISMSRRFPEHSAPPTCPVYHFQEQHLLS